MVLWSKPHSFNNESDFDMKNRREFRFTLNHFTRPVTASIPLKTLPRNVETMTTDLTFTLTTSGSLTEPDTPLGFLLSVHDSFCLGFINLRTRRLL